MSERAPDATEPSGRKSGDLPRWGSLRATLLRSHLTVASIGLGSLVLTLLVARYMQVSALRLAQGRGPAVHAAARALAGVQRSLADLRGSMDGQEDPLRQDWRRAWSKEITPSIAELDELSWRWTGAEGEDLARLSQAKNVLLELREIQLQIEDVIATQREGDLAEQMLGEEALSRADLLSELLTGIAEHQRLRMDTDAARVTRLGYAVIGMSVALIALLAAIMWLSFRRDAATISEPISRLAQATRQMAEGRLTEDIPVTRADELGELTASFNQMRTSVRRVEQALRRQEAESRTIFESSPSAMIMTDASGKVVLLNSRTETLFGYSREELIGQPIETLVSERLRSRHEALRESFNRCPESREMGMGRPLLGRRKDGSEIPVEIGLNPIHTDEGPFVLAAILDLTELHRVMSALQEAKQAAEAANRAKGEFLANMSHEIRTPMNGILGMTELLFNTQLTGEQRDYLGIAKTSADALLRLLNDILDFSKIEAGKLALEAIDFSLRDCVGTTGKSLASRAADKGLELNCRIAPSLPDLLLGDPGRLRQVIVNLAGNAIKFTEQGEVVIEVEEESRSQQEIHLRFLVRDTGVGVSPEKQRLIFEAFTQADASTTRNFGGTGLGLTIASQLVEMMGGRIWLESETGKGAVFYFTTAFGIAAEQERQRQTDLSAIEGLNVLVVNDNETNRRILKEILLSWRLNATVVDGGSAALAELRRAAGVGHPHQLALLDYMMPTMDGLELAERIKQDPALQDIKMMMISSAARPGDAERCREAGICRHMTKPLVQSELLDAMLAVLGRPAVEELSDKTSHTPATCKPPLHILLAEDGVINQRVAIELLKSGGHHVHVANNGEEAVAVLEGGSFDLVLMDVQMPVMDGYEATAAIREREKRSGRRTPIIAMTAAAMKGDRERCLQAGMDGYISKPVDPHRLQQAIDEFTGDPIADAEELGEDSSRFDV